MIRMETKPLPLSRPLAYSEDMSDGIEEREEQKQRREQQKREDRDDWVERDDLDDWRPERVDS